MYSTWFFFAQIQRFRLQMSQEVQLIDMLSNLIAHNCLIEIFVCVINPIFYLAQGVQLVNRREIVNEANGGRVSGVKKRGRLGSGHIEKAREVWVGSHRKCAGGLGRVTQRGARQFPLLTPLYSVGDDWSPHRSLGKPCDPPKILQTPLFPSPPPHPVRREIITARPASILLIFICHFWQPWSPTFCIQTKWRRPRQN